MLEHTITVGDYLAAIVGYAALRDVIRDPVAVEARMTELRQIVESSGAFPFDLPLPITEHEITAGYAKWAAVYDGGGNPAIVAEEDEMIRRLADLPAGTALDAACGTGRHCVNLARLGHRVTGVDLTDEMLSVARARLPEAEFRQGSLHELPVDDDAFDVITCALALCHVVDLEPVATEFARVLRPGGRLFVSDMHPSSTERGGGAVFPTDDGSLGIPFVRNHPHQISDYLGAMAGVGFEFVHLSEILGTEAQAQLLPSYQVFPAATIRAFANSPLIAIFEWVKPRRA
jgi:SAM-dependent methyltransferase